MNTGSSTLYTSTAQIALLASGEAGVPEWIEILPAGGTIHGRDGRVFSNDDSAQVVANTIEYNTGRDIVVDYEHATDKAASRGQPAPAAGWINQLEVRDAAIWGKVSWNATARAMISSKEYRYISPVFLHTKATDGGKVLVILRAALTNDPNLSLTALNTPQPQPETSMNIPKILAALGLQATATEAEVVTAINSARAAQAQSMGTPDLTAYVPKAQHDAVVTELNTVKADNAKRDKDAFAASVEAMLDTAIGAGKVVPAAREQYKAMCATQAGLDNFKALVEKLPVIASAESGVTAGKVGDTATGVLGAEEIAACSALGLTHEQFLATKKKEAA
jgi:phage I-like protein